MRLRVSELRSPSHLRRVAVASPASAGNPAAGHRSVLERKAVGPDRLRRVRRLGQRQPQREQLALPRGRLRPVPHEADGLTPGTSYSFTIGYDTIQGGARLRLPHVVQPHRAGCEPVRRVLTVRRGVRPARFRPIRRSCSRIRARRRPAGLISIWNGNVTGVAYGPAVTGFTRSGLSFTATASTVVVAWGGHIGVADRLGSRQQRGRDQRGRRTTCGSRAAASECGRTRTAR